MLSPQPRRVFAALPGSPKFQTPCTPIKDLIQGLTTPRPLWFDLDEADVEIREVMGGKVVPDWLPAFGRRPLSSASTSAGSSPLTNDMASPYGRNSPLLSPATPCDRDSIFESPMRPQLSKSPGGENSEGWSQARKVFFGGIPQDFDQNDLFKASSKYGTVKKAWLQLVQGQAKASQKHRGFGFVIFSESRSVDLLLGDEVSKFIWVAEGVKLEVKRAVSRTDTSVAKEQRTVSSMKQTRLDSKFASPSVDLQSKQDQTRRIALGDRTNTSLPQLPPFPPVFSSASPWAASNDKPQPQPTTAWRCSLSEQSNASAFSSPFVSPSEFLLGGLAAQRPCSKELERVLLQAMPDHYDD